MTRREFIKALGFVTVAAALVRPARALQRTPRPRREAQDASAPPDSDYQRMKRLRVDYLLAEWNPEKQAAISPELVALSVDMQRAGTSWPVIAAMGNTSLHDARREVAALPPSRLPRAMVSSSGRLTGRSLYS